jgi:hypothetical protein
MRLLLGRPTLRWMLRRAPPLLERPSCFLGLGLNSRNFMAFFVKRPMLARGATLNVHTTNPMVG